MSIFINSRAESGSCASEEDIPARAALEARYRQARARLEQAQAERTEAVCQFLEAEARWRVAASRDEGGPFHESPHFTEGAGGADPLGQAESQVRLAKTLYCAALEQHALLRQMLCHLRWAYQCAQENLDRLAARDQ